MSQTDKDKARVTLGGEEYTLRLSVGAMQDIEDHFDMPLAGLSDRFGKNPRVGEMLVVVEALCEGGGNPISRDDLRALDVEELVAAVEAAFPADEGAAPSGKAQSRPRRRGAAGAK